jgi:hypothetical protein
VFVLSELSLEPWQAIKENSQLLKASASALAKLSVKLEKACSDGSLSDVSTLGIQITDEVSLIRDLKKTIADLADELKNSVASLQSEVESLCRSQQVSKHIFSTGSNLVVFPLVLKFSITEGSPSILIGSEKFKSFKAGSVVEKINEILSKKFDPSAFLKSMRYAYLMLLKNENQTDVSLEDIRQLMAISHESTNRISKDQFSYLLQLFVACEQTDKDLPVPQFKPVAAATTRFLIFKSDGTSISVGALSFDDQGKK